jgi:protein-tyrosine-phosphatase/DNA-binding transcriptional ArsR family regulator
MSYPDARSLVARARTHNALGDATRRAVVDLVHHSDRSPDDLARRLGVTPNLLTHHLRILEGAGIVRRVVSEGDRRRSYVQAVPGALEAIAVAPLTWVAPRVLFVCTRNSARSILAAALWSRTSDVPAASAGTKPAQEVHPMAVRAAMRLGLGVSPRNHEDVHRLGRPRHVSEVEQPGDLVVSTCDAAREEMVRGTAPSIHWSVADPVAVGTEAAFEVAIRDLSWRVGRLAAAVATSVACASGPP